MSIASEITRLQGVKADILQAISDKGVIVPAGSMLDDCPNLISQISGTSPLSIRYETDFSNFNVSEKYDIPQNGWITRYPLSATYSINNGLVITSNTSISEGFLSFYIQDGSKFEVNLSFDVSINQYSNFFWFHRDFNLRVNDSLGNNNIYITVPPTTNVDTSLPSGTDPGGLNFNTGVTAGSFHKFEFVCNNGQIWIYLDDNLILKLTDNYIGQLFVCLFAPQQNKSISCRYLNYSP